MSDWLRLLSEIKQRPTEELLTTTQGRVCQILCDALDFPQWINLYGAAGSGKTFTAWAVTRTTGARHLPMSFMLDELKPSNDILIVDNAPHHETEVRRILAKCNLLNTRSLVLITRHPVDMPMRAVELSLPTTEDVRKIMRTLERCGFYSQQTLPTNSNLWTILRSCI